MLERGLNEYKVRIVDFGIELQQLKIRWVEELLDFDSRGEAAEGDESAVRAGLHPASTNG
jgi:hypothetical protein